MLFEKHVHKFLLYYNAALLFRKDLHDSTIVDGSLSARTRGRGGIRHSATDQTPPTHGATGTSAYLTYADLVRAHIS